MVSRARNFTVEDAREKILAKLRKAGPKGTAALFTAATPAEKRGLYEQALREMTSSGTVVATPSQAKPKYFLREFAPSAELAAVKVERYAAAQHPTVFAQPGLAKALVAVEKPFLAEALQLLEAGARFIRLVHGKAFVFAHADSLRAAIGGTSPSGLPSGPASPASPLETESPFDPRRVRDAYRALSGRTGFLDLEIAALQRESGVSMRALKEWLLAEHQSGRANFYLGDWSLADDQSRTGAVELRGERYLLVRLEE